jgi:putative OmpL-like beta-barrel porin-2
LKLIEAKLFSMAEDCNAVSLSEIPQGTETRFQFGACMGIMVESVSRTSTALRGLRDFAEAWGGYHFNVNHGLNVDAGIFVSYIGLFSYYNFDNWAYQPSFVSSNTP